MKPSSARAKGHTGQHEVVKILSEWSGVPECDFTTAGYRQGGEDIKLSTQAREKFPFSIEVKRVEKLNVWAALQQAIRNSTRGFPGVLIFRRNRGEWFISMDFQTFLNKVLGANK